MLSDGLSPSSGRRSQAAKKKPGWPMRASPEDCFVSTIYYLMPGMGQCGFTVGSHSGTGPLRAGTLGRVAYANVPTRPTNSSNALSERFIVLLSLGSTRGWHESTDLERENYTHPCNFQINRRLRRRRTRVQDWHGCRERGRKGRGALVKGFSVLLKVLVEYNCRLSGLSGGRTPNRLNSS